MRKSQNCETKSPNFRAVWVSLDGRWPGWLSLQPISPPGLRVSPRKFPQRRRRPRRLLNMRIRPAALPLPLWLLHQPQHRAKNVSFPPRHANLHLPRWRPRPSSLPPRDSPTPRATTPHPRTVASCPRVRRIALHLLPILSTPFLARSLCPSPDCLPQAPVLSDWGFHPRLPHIPMPPSRLHHPCPRVGFHERHHRLLLPPLETLVRVPP